MSATSGPPWPAAIGSGPGWPTASTSISGPRRKRSALPAGRTFDFAFIDADKPGYDTYYELLLPRMRPNALFVFDNMLFDGRIENPDLESAVALNALNQKLARDPRVESVLLPFADGLHIARVR